MRSSCIATCGRLSITGLAALAILVTSSHAWGQGSDARDTPEDATSPAAPVSATAQGDDAAEPSQPTTAEDKAAEPAESADTPGAGAGTDTDTTGTTGTSDPDTTTRTTSELDTSDMPVNLRLRRLEQRVQALKERAWRAKARVGMLKEAVLGGGVGATATVVHRNKMGNSFRLVKLVYALDGAQVFARADDSGALHKNKVFEVLTGPIAPGSHTISVLAVYRGHGYGVFKYLTKYKFTVRSSHTFTATEGKATRIEAVGFERGGATTPLEDRPAMDFKVSHASGPGGE